jgi:hypothetical protein
MLLIDTLLTAAEYCTAAHLTQYLQVLLRLSDHRNSFWKPGSLKTLKWVVNYKSGIIRPGDSAVNDKFPDAPAVRPTTHDRRRFAHRTDQRSARPDDDRQGSRYG